MSEETKTSKDTETKSVRVMIYRDWNALCSGRLRCLLVRAEDNIPIPKAGELVEAYHKSRATGNEDGVEFLVTHVLKIGLEKVYGTDTVYVLSGELYSTRTRTANRRRELRRLNQQLSRMSLKR